MGNLLSVNAAAVAARSSERDAAGGPTTTETTGVNNVSAMSQVTGKSGRTTGGSGATAATVATVAGQKSVQPLQPKESDDEEESKDPDFDLCGLPWGMNFNEWEETPLPTRIKESLLTPEEKAKFRGHLDRIFDGDTVSGRRVVFEANDIIEVMEAVIPYLASEPMLIEDVPFDITIVADLHGQLHDLDRVFYGDEKDGKPGWECMKYLFLGDYVDRGRQSLEIVMALFCIKMLHPDRIFLLRGNHEFLDINSRYGFALDFIDRFAEEEEWQCLFVKVNEAFCYLSAAAIVGNSYFCAHGGVAPSGPTRRHLLGIQKPMIDSTEDMLVHHLVWSEVADGLEGWVRQSGFAIVGSLCVSLFTATGVTKAMNDGAFAYFDHAGKMTVRIMECDPARVRLDKESKAVDAGYEYVDGVDSDDDCLTVFEHADNDEEAKIPS